MLSLSSSLKLTGSCLFYWHAREYGNRSRRAMQVRTPVSAKFCLHKEGKFNVATFYNFSSKLQFDCLSWRMWEHNHKNCVVFAPVFRLIRVWVPAFWQVKMTFMLGNNFWATSQRTSLALKTCESHYIEAIFQLTKKWIEEGALIPSKSMIQNCQKK